MKSRLCKSVVVMMAVLMAAQVCRALDKEVSLVTKQPVGEMAVAGRLSIDLHAEFMMTRTYESQAVINWYNLGYSGGGGKDGKVTTVGGDFGDFGFQVPFDQRDKKYPHAVKIGNVQAAHFDGNDWLKGNFEIEPKLAGAGSTMALEIWYAGGEKGEAILGWQSCDGKEASAAIALPSTSAANQLRHLVINCTPEKEDWYVDGVKVAGGARKTIVKEGHVMVLGGASEKSPSFKGDLVAVRLHDQAMTEEEIAHNFKGGAMLGTEMHNWWRIDAPEKRWVKESEHFRHCVDKEEMAKWSQKELTEFNGRVPGMFNLSELIYHTYTERLAFRSSVVSVLPAERGDGIKYRIPIQPSQGSWMGWDGHFGYSCQGAGFINPHELAHGFSCMTGNMAGNFWETFANWPQTYVGIYQTIPVIMAECSAFPSNGRTYYHDRLMFEHLAHEPEYGPAFIAKMWYDGPIGSATDDEKSPYPWVTFTRLNPYPAKTLAVEWTRMVMRNVTYDYETYAEDIGGQRGNTPYGNDHVVSKENIYQRAAKNSTPEIKRYARTQLEKIPYDQQWWRVSKDQAPQQLGWNICPLTLKQGKVSAKLAGYVNPDRGPNWSAGFVSVDAEGKPTYGEPFGPGKEQSFDVKADAKELFLVVCAVPDKIMSINMVGDFRAFEQEQFPYMVKFDGCQPLDVMVTEKPTAAGAAHANGGGFVEKSAHVDATAYVGPNAQVLGNSKVLGNARIEDYAVIQNATVKDNAIVCGHALVKEDSVIAENAKVRDFAVVKGKTNIKGNAKILEHSAIFTNQKTCGENVTVKGVASVYGGSQSGSAMLDGFYAKGNEITRGRWFTWSWGAGKNPGEVDENFGGVYADYTFDREHPTMAWDSFGVTWGYLVNGPKYEAVSESEKPKSTLPKYDPAAKYTNHALVLNGKDQFVELPKDVADMGDCTYTAEIMWNGGEGERVFEFANENGDAMWLSPSENGKLVFAIRKGGAVQQVAAPAMKKGAWTTVQVVMEGSLCTLLVDGKSVAENVKMFRPDSIRATHCYLGGGQQGGYFTGKIDRFTIHCVPLFDKTAPTPNPAAFEPAPQVISPKAVALTAALGSDPLGVVEYYFEQEGGGWNSGWVKDTFIRVETKDPSSPPRYRVKMRDVHGNEGQFSAYTSPAPLKSSAMVTVTADGPAVIEAEHCVASVPSLDGTFKWEMHNNNPDGAVGEYMSTPDRGQVNEPFNPTAAHMDYVVNFAKPWRYFLWVRANGNNDGGASIHAGLGLKPGAWGLNLHTGNGRWAWTRSKPFQVDAAGACLFSIWMREDGAMVDRFLFTADEKYEPTPDARAADKTMIGPGPAETPAQK